MPDVELGEVWTELAPRLLRLLAARGVRGDEAEDLVQDVALKVIEHDVAFTGANDLYAWTSTAVRNAHLNAVRDTCRRRSPRELPDMPSGQDVEQLVLGRIALTRVLLSLSTLSPQDQEALLSTVDEPGAPTASQLRVRRFRARSRLWRALGEDASEAR